MASVDAGRGASDGAGRGRGERGERGAPGRGGDGEARGSRFRDRDAIDYALVSAVALLLYLEAPFRPAIRESLRRLVALVAAVPGFLGAGSVPVEVTLVGTAALALGVLLLLVYLPRRQG